jgi:hypothetical protein
MSSSTIQKGYSKPRNTLKGWGEMLQPQWQQVIRDQFHKHALIPSKWREMSSIVVNSELTRYLLQYLMHNVHEYLLVIWQRYKCKYSVCKQHHHHGGCTEPEQTLKQLTYFCQKVPSSTIQPIFSCTDQLKPLVKLIVGHVAPFLLTRLTNHEMADKESGDDVFVQINSRDYSVGGTTARSCGLDLAATYYKYTSCQLLLVHYKLPCMNSLRMGLWAMLYSRICGVFSTCMLYICLWTLHVHTYVQGNTWNGLFFTFQYFKSHVENLRKNSNLHLVQKAALKFLWLLCTGKCFDFHLFLVIHM